MIRTGIPDTRLLIGGDWYNASSGEEMPVVNPTTGQMIASVMKASHDDVSQAYRAAEQAFPKWYSLGVKGRSAIVQEFGKAIAENKRQLAELDTLNSGNPIRGMLRDIDVTVGRIEQSVHFAASIHGSTIESSGVMNLHYTRYEPYGVVARIVPFNHPLLFAATKIIPPLLMGNTVLLKPSDYTPLSALALGQLIKDIFPTGVVNMLPGDRETGEAIIQHPRIKRIGFTGSARTGMAIIKSAADVGIKNISMELGGKNPMIVFPDADLEEAAKNAVIGMGYGATQGQSCGSTSRVFVHRDVYEDFVGMLVENTNRLKVDDPLKEETDIGPMVSEQHMQRVLSYIELGQMEGADLLHGGERPNTGIGSKGFFITPAIFTNVRPSMSIAQEEIFGPVTCVLSWDDYEQMIHEANDVEYGLTASIWTRDLRLAHKTSHKINVGYVWINTSAKHYVGLPFGGYKNSGVGREESMDELLSYCETKAVNINIEG